MNMTTNPESEADVVRRYTSPEMLQKIEDQIEDNIRLYSVQPPDVISRRLDELRREWSMERYLQINVAAGGILTAMLALTRSEKWAILTCTALGFFLYHGVRGYDPPIPILRRLGVRTRTEIDRELYALKAARGDFKDLPENKPPESISFSKEILHAVNR